MTKAEFSELIKEYRNQFYVVANTILKNEDDAMDAVCNAILKGYEHLDQLKKRDSFKAWMITITKNEALKILQKRVSLPGDEQIEKMLEPVHDKHDELWDVISKLSYEYRLVLVLFYYDGLSIKEISEVLSISEGTVKSRLNRGRNQLKNLLEGGSGNE